MKIKAGLPQFARKAALLIVTGKQKGIFYRAEDGEIEQLFEYEVATPKFSDNEGFFANRGGGQIFVSGSVAESQKEYIIQESMKELKKDLKEIWSHGKYDQVYVYAPDHVVMMVKDEVKKIVKDAYENSYRGNYLHAHPLELLEMIQERKARRAVRVIPSKAQKILVRR